MLLNKRSTPAQDFVKSLITKNFPLQERFENSKPLISISPFNFFSILLKWDMIDNKDGHIKIYQESVSKCNSQKKIIKRLEFYPDGSDMHSSELKNIEVCYKSNEKPLDLQRESINVLSEYGFSFRVNDYAYRSKTYSLITSENGFYNVLGIRLPDINKVDTIIDLSDVNFGTIFANSTCYAVEFRIGISDFVYLNGAIHIIHSPVKLRSFTQLYQRMKDKKRMISFFK